MPNPAEVAVISFQGVAYQAWEWMEFERRIGSIMSHLRVRVVETQSGTPQGWAALKLKPLDGPITATLAGRTVMSDGEVSIRQAALAPESHQIEIVVFSRTGAITVSSPPPQQFKNASMQQISNALLAPYGINFTLAGNTPGADKPFERFSTHMGETTLQAIERMARMRNLHLTVGTDNTLIALRGATPQGAPSSSTSGRTVAVPANGLGFPSTNIGTLVEGQNIERGNIVMSIDEMVYQLTASGQNFGNDNHWGDDARDVAATANTGLSGYRPLQFFAEMPGDKQDMQMRADMEAAAQLAREITAYITVPGWLLPDGGSVWAEHLAESVTVRSPSLFPVDSISLAIRGVKHHQSNESGTISTLELCLPQALSSGGQIGPGSYPPGVQPAVPSPPA